MLNALQSLIDHRVLHRDIKPSNILLRRQPLAAVLADFGAAVVLEQTLEHGVDSKEAVCTPGYEAPEVLWKRRYSYPSDTWSMGVSLVEGITKQHPFGRGFKNDQSLLQAMWIALYTGGSAADERQFVNGKGGLERFRSMQCVTPNFLESMQDRVAKILRDMLRAESSARRDPDALLAT